MIYALILVGSFTVADSNRDELLSKVQRLADARFGGSVEKLLTHYDTNKDDKYNRQELGRLLQDANVGNRLTRNRWIDGIFAQLDTNRDGFISRQEFLKAVEKSNGKEVQPNSR